MAEQEVAVVPPVVDLSTDKEPATTDLKRKLDDLEPHGKTEADLNAPSQDDLPKDELNSNSANELKAADDSLPDAKMPRLDEESDGSANWILNDLVGLLYISSPPLSYPFSGLQKVLFTVDLNLPEMIDYVDQKMAKCYSSFKYRLCTHYLKCGLAVVGRATLPPPDLW